MNREINFTRPCCQCVTHGSSRREAGRDACQVEPVDRRQPTAVERRGKAGTTGVGFIENVARTVSDYELIWVTILIMGSLGLIFDLMMRWVIERLIPWRGKG